MWLSGLRTQRSVCEDAGSIPGLTQWFKDWVLQQTEAWVTNAALISIAVAVVRPETAALIHPLAEELPYTTGTAVKRKNNNNNKNKTKQKSGSTTNGS